MSAFEKAGYITQAGGRNSLKITIEGRVYFVAVTDVLKVLKTPKFAAQIVALRKTDPPKPKEGGTLLDKRLDFSVHF